MLGSTAARTRVARPLAVATLLLATARTNAQDGGGSGGLGKPPTPPVPARTPAPERAPKPQAAPGEINLAPRFRAGDVARYVMVNDQVSDTRSPSNPALDGRTTQKSEFGLVVRVKDSSPEGATIELVYESVKLEIDSAAIKGKFDSAAPPTKTPAPAPGARGPALPGDLSDDEMLASMARPMVGVTLTIKTDARGNILSVTGGEALSLGAGGPGIDPKAAAGWLITGTSGGRTAVRVGESWTNDDRLGGTPVGDLAMRTTHRLDRASRGEADVSFTGRIQPGSASGALQGIQIGPSTYAGQYVWDTESGQLKSMRTESAVTLDGKFAGQDMSVKSRSASTVTRR
ncbi:MAG: hypothetical protein JNM07_14050 [Phycisphaerae bacterium]|nr:hypothetical protein [Phycisphaerae bacterium]